jgi:Fe-S cluster assembly ATP-binding protein
MLTLTNFAVSTWEKQIIHPLNYSFETGMTTAILWHNGSGKSSLAFALMGHPRYRCSGELALDDNDIIELTPDERHRKGLFLSFQNIPELPGVKTCEYLRTVYNAHFNDKNLWPKAPSPFVFRRIVEKMTAEVGLEKGILDRDLFAGFSGGEKRRLEILQIELLNPNIIILDEIDSWLDVDALELLRQKIEKWRASGKTIIIISHNFHLLDSIDVNRIIIMKDWQMIDSGERNLVDKVRKEGFR